MYRILPRYESLNVRDCPQISASPVATIFRDGVTTSAYRVQGNVRGVFEWNGKPAYVVATHTLVNEETE